MFARPQTRRHAWVLPILILSALVAAQSVFTYSDLKGDLSIRSKDGQGTMLEDGYRFDLKGSVTVSSKSRRFTLQANQVQANIGKGASSTSPNELKTAKASGNVSITQTAPGKSSTLQSNSATYTAKGTKSLVQVTGSVRLKNTDAGKREVLTATGSSGSATLNPSSARGLEQATLNGPVKVEIIQSGTQASRVVFTGGKMTFAGSTVTLTGNVKATGSGASRFGNLSNVDSLTVHLNDKGEMTRFSFKSGGA